MSEELSLFDFDDYRRFLRFYLDKQPRKGRGLLRSWAQSLGIHTTLMSQIMAGLRELSEDQALHLSDLIGLPRLEQEYFLAVVRYERAQTPKLKSFLKKTLETLRANSKKIANRVSEHQQLNDQQRATFYSSWIYAAISLWSSIGDGTTIEQIESQFEIPRPQLQPILDFMIEAQLLQYKNGVYTMGAQSTHLPQGSPFLIRHHTNWRLHALRRGERLDPEELMYTAPFSISETDMKRLREKLLLVIKDFVELAKQSPAEKMACFNLDLIYIKK